MPDTDVPKVPADYTGKVTDRRRLLISYEYRHSLQARLLNKIAELYIWIARLGGYIARASDPPPGVISLWRGWQRLSEIVDDHRDIYG